MSIAVLNQVYDETRRLVIAGSGLAPGDFRLKKLVEPLRKSGAKAPVFAKVADSIEKLVDGNEKNSPQALLDLSSLVLAILYTQGATGVKGAAKPIESLDVGISTTQVSSRVLKPLLEALTTTGSGRHETVREANERGAFNDLRLVNPAINALDDKYGELADYMADEVLPKFGPAIVPEIKSRIDIKGTSGNVRRLRLLYRLAPKVARPIVEEAFEKGSKDMKIAALGCLGDAREDLPHLLEQATARSKEVRRVALDRLAPFKGADVDAIFEKAIGGADLELAVAPLTKTKNTKLVAMAQAQLQQSFNELFTTKDTKKLDKLIDRVDVLIFCFHGRSEKSTVALLGKLFEDRARLVARKRVGVSVFSTLCTVMLSTGDKKLLTALAGVHGEFKDGDNGFASSVVAALKTLKPKQVFDELSEYYARARDKRRHRSSDKSDVVSWLLCGNMYYFYYHNYMHPLMYRGMRDVEDEEWLKSIKWDPRWLDLAIERRDVEVVSNLATPKDRKALDFLADYIEKKGSKADYWELNQAMERLVAAKDKRATELVVELLKTHAKAKRTYYYAHAAVELISRLPKSAAKTIEAAMKEFPDRLVDEIMPQLLTLKQKTK